MDLPHSSQQPWHHTPALPMHMHARAAMAWQRAECSCRSQGSGRRIHRPCMHDTLTLRALGQPDSSSSSSSLRPDQLHRVSWWRHHDARYPASCIKGKGQCEGLSGIQ